MLSKGNSVESYSSSNITDLSIRVLPNHQPHMLITPTRRVLRVMPLSLPYHLWKGSLFFHPRHDTSLYIWYQANNHLQVQDTPHSARIFIAVTSKTPHGSHELNPRSQPFPPLVGCLYPIKQSTQSAKPNANANTKPQTVDSRRDGKKSRVNRASRHKRLVGHQRMQAAPSQPVFINGNVSATATATFFFSALRIQARPERAPFSRSGRVGQDVSCIMRFHTR